MDFFRRGGLKLLTSVRAIRAYFVASTVTLVVSPGRTSTSVSGIEVHELLDKVTTRISVCRPGGACGKTNRPSASVCALNPEPAEIVLKSPPPYSNARD